MTWNFKVGDRVVCVDDASRPEGGGSGPDVCNWIAKGNIYTIRKVGGRVRMLIWLSGINRKTEGFSDSGFLAVRFRPVASKPTSMDIIRSIVLDPSKPIPDDPREPVITPVPEYHPDMGRI